MAIYSVRYRTNWFGINQVTEERYQDFADRAEAERFIEQEIKYMTTVADGGWTSYLGLPWSVQDKNRNIQTYYIRTVG